MSDSQAPGGGSRRNRPVRRDVLIYAGAAALGGALWAVKSMSILITGEQPEYIFMIAPFLFGIACLGVADAAGQAESRHHALLKEVAWVAVIAGGAGAVASLSGGEDGPFGAPVAVAMLAVLAVLLWGGYRIRRSGVLGRWSFGPWALAWLMLASLPIGGALESVNERLLEVPLLAVGVAWIGLGIAMAVTALDEA